MPLVVSLVVLVGACVSAGALSMPTQTNSQDDIRSAVAMSQLILAQQAQFFRELINATKNNYNCCSRFKSDPNRSGDLDYEERGGCPYPFKAVLDECFYLSQEGLSWHSARHSCRGMGGEMATPSHLYALKVFVADNRGPRMVWLGGQDNGLDGGWKWVNGQAVDKSDWGTKQPNERRPVEQCLALRRDRHPVLHGMACHSTQRYICQYIS